MTSRFFLHSDAALIVVEREGVGRMRNMNTNVLWFQDNRLKEQVTFMKIGGKQFPADLCTKHVDRTLSEKNVTTMMSVKDMDGSASFAAHARYLFDDDILHNVTIGTENDQQLSTAVQAPGTRCGLHSRYRIGIAKR